MKIALNCSPGATLLRRSPLISAFVGAVIGAAVGFIPGVAVTRPLTGGYFSGGTTCDESGCTGVWSSVGPFLDVPWLMILTLVIALPLLTAVLVGLATRSRLPLVARLE